MGRRYSKLRKPRARRCTALNTLFNPSRKDLGHSVLPVREDSLQVSLDRLGELDHLHKQRPKLPAPLPPPQRHQASTRRRAAPALSSRSAS